MADDDAQTAGDQTCSPCRGTGHLISGLGGEPHQVVCPWCQGTGHRIPGIDAQAAPAEGGAPGGTPDVGDDGPAGGDAPSVT